MKVNVSTIIQDPEIGETKYFAKKERLMIELIQKEAKNR